MEGRCVNCNELIYDTEKLDEIPRKVECQHCHHVNLISRESRARKPAKGTGKPASKPIKPARAPLVVASTVEASTEEQGEE